MQEHVDLDTPCELWQGALTPQGYGRAFRSVLAHRQAYEQNVGPIPAGLVIDHLCRVRRCVNFRHLEVVTMTENNRRGNGWSGRKARQTHCVNGHEFSPENTQRIEDGRHRRCATCHRERERERARRRAALIVAAVVVALFSIGYNLAPPVDARPLPAHHPVALFGSAHCLPSGVWQATLTVTADVPGGTAHLQPPTATGFDRQMPVSNLFTISGAVATFTVQVTVQWPDFTAPALTATATRPPEGCTVPTTSTTDCAHAIPIRDCTEVTTSTSTNALPPTTNSSASTPSSSTGGSSSSLAPQQPSNRPTTASSPSVTTTSRSPSGSSNLPATGTDWPAVVAAGLATAIVGAGLVLCARRRGV